jgi:hypothetical protein
MHGEESYYTVEAAERGTMLHARFAAILTNGTCNTDDGEPYTHWDFAAWTWITSQHFRTGNIRVEQTMVATRKILPFAGTADLLYIAKDGRSARVIDLKTGAPQWWHRVQLQAYGKLVTDTMGLAVECMEILYIHHDQPIPKTVTVKPSALDWAAFCNALSLLIYREGRR